MPEASPFCSVWLYLPFYTKAPKMQAFYLHIIAQRINSDCERVYKTDSCSTVEFAFSLFIWLLKPTRNLPFEVKFGKLHGMLH